MSALAEPVAPAAPPSDEGAVPAAAAAAATAAAASPPTNGAAEQPQQRVRLIRVKRKRGTDAPEDLVVEGLAAPGKRAHTSLSSAMAGLGLSQQQAAAPADAAQQGQQQEPAEGAEQPAARRQRYRRLSTLSAAQLKAMDASQLSSLLASGSSSEAAAQLAQRRAPVKGGLQPAGGGTAERAAGARQAGAAARYEQIRRRRGGLSNFSITEQAADPLEGLAAVVDLVAYPQEGSTAGASDAAGNGSSSARTSSGFGGPQPQRPSRAQRAAQQYDEGTLMCNYLPMVREYLASQGKADLPLPGSTAAAGDEGSTPGADPMAADAAAEEEGDADEYVYDLYAAVPEDEAGGEGQREAWQELHASGHAPVVQIIDEDTWLVLEGSDADDSDADSEDSNAEGFYAHDYPEEESEHSSSDGGYDPEGGTFQPGKRPSGLQRRWRDGDSYGYGSGSDSDGW